MLRLDVLGGRHMGRVIASDFERTIKGECGWRGRGGICCDAQTDVFPIVAAAAKPVVDWLTGALVGVVARAAGDKFLGTPQQRAIHAACEAAVERAVHDVSAAGASEEDIVHALALTQRLVGLRDLVDLKAAGSTRQRVPLAEWQQRFDELGYDPQTFPVSFEQLVDRITVYLQEELRAHARDRGSPLFGSAVLDDLDVVISTVREIARVFQGWSVARLLPLSAAVKSALDGQRGYCEAIGRPFFTPDLLLALLTMPGRVAQCFDEAEPASAGRVRSQLLFYTARLPAGTAGGFVPFDWVEREDVRRAQDAAWRAGALVVTDVHLLLGVLDTPSVTRQQLETKSGVRLKPLRAAALRLADQPPPVTPTPGPIWPEPG